MHFIEAEKGLTLARKAGKAESITDGFGGMI